MKYRVTLKDTDSLHDCVVEAVRSMNDANVTREEQKLISSHREEKFKKIAYKWFEYGEYLTVEIDTEKNTCTVIPVGE